MPKSPPLTRSLPLSLSPNDNPRPSRSPTTIDSLFVVSPIGEILIEKHYANGTPRSLINDLFWEREMRLLGNATATEEEVEAAVSKRDARDDDDDDVDDDDDELENDDDDDKLRDDFPPLVKLARGRYAIHVKRGDLVLVAALSRETQPLSVIEFLHTMGDVMEEYLGSPLNEFKVKDSFTVVYLLIEEMADGGFPMVTEVNALKRMISPPNAMLQVAAALTGSTASSVSSALPSGATSVVPWRERDVKYLQNEIFVDVEESIDCVLDSVGGTFSSPSSLDVRGAIKITSRLSSMPDVLLRFRDPSVLGDCAFHPCVRVERWEREGVLSFIPPDGTFELMTYRLAPRVMKSLRASIAASPAVMNSIIPAYCTPQVTVASPFSASISSSSSPVASAGEQQQQQRMLPGRIEVMVGLRGGHTNATLENVVVRLPLPPHARYMDAKTGSGKVAFADRCCVWTIGTIAPGDAARRLTGSFSVPIQASSSTSPPPSTSSGTTTAPPFESISSCFLEFSQATRLVSDLTVESLEVVNQAYNFFKGVKTVVKSGQVEMRWATTTTTTTAT